MKRALGWNKAALRILSPKAWAPKTARWTRACSARWKRRPDLSDWNRSLSDPTAFYDDCTVWFDAFLDPALRAHRRYFRRNSRGFGEDAFHVMWWLLFERLRPGRFLEIGVYRGQVLSLAALLQAKMKIQGTPVGITPLQAVNDHVSRYAHGLDYEQDIRLNFAAFDLPEPRLVRGLSSDPDAVKTIRTGLWDCIYVDGGHDFETVAQDWANAAAGIRPGGVIVLDDSGLGTGYRPPCFATGGHPGPSAVAKRIDPRVFREILQVGHNRVFQRMPAAMPGDPIA